MNRRDFLKSSGAVTALLAVNIPVHSAAKELVVPPTNTDFCIDLDKTGDFLVAESIDQHGLVKDVQISCSLSITELLDGTSVGKKGIVYSKELDISIDCMLVNCRICYVHGMYIEAEFRGVYSGTS